MVKQTIKWDMTIKLCPAFILLYAAIASITVCAAIVVYVRPDNDYAHCPGEPCNPLSYYEQPNTGYFVWVSDTTMVFLNGIHYASQQMIIENIENFTMIGSGGFTLGLEDLPEARSKIECVGTHTSGFNFINVTGIHMENLTFTYCGQEVVSRVRAALAFNVVYNVILSRVTVRNSSGFGLYADRVFGNVWVYESAFLHNTGSKEYYGGNARFWYGECPKNHSTYLQIESSYFLHGNDSSKNDHPYYPSATGLTLLIQCPAITVSINNITMVGNQAENGGNIAINFTDFTSNYHHYGPEVPSVVINNSRITDGTGHRGGGIRVWSVIVAAIKDEISYSQRLSNRCILQISNTQFVDNHAYSIFGGGALYVIHYETEQTDYITRQICIENCTFSANTAPLTGHGAVMVAAKVKFLEYTSPVTPQFELVIQNCSFHNNSIVRDKNNPFSGATSIYIFSIERVIFSNCKFTKNNSTALSLVDSNLVLEGNILFDGNHAINGGALRLCDTSVVYIRNNTHIKFYNNHAKHAGGAIYAQQQCLEAIVSPCFLQPHIPDFTNVADLKKWMSLTFVNNTAQYAGSGLYGGTIDHCYTYQYFIKYTTKSHTASYYFFPEIVNAVFDFHQQPGDSPISSDPYGVCLCNESGNIDCFHKNWKLPRSIYPGEVFNLSAVAVGQRHGVVPAKIFGKVISSQILFLFEQNQHTNNTCVTLTHTLHSKNQRETLELTVEPSASFFHHNFPPPSITVSLHPCPCGFTLQHDPPYCDCDPWLVRHKISCNIDKQTIHREVPIWIGYYGRTLNSSLSALASKVEELDQGTCQGVVIHLQCPYDYCVLMNTNISVNSTDEQCAFNRTGILCGKCQDGFSLILGSSKCLPCSNLYFLFLIVFVLAGLALVTFVTLCNLTVSEGKIIGFIFYANVVHINRTIFFPSTEANPLAVFVAWLNLDLGIETCFYNGMDAYAKTWLQFVFPIYIWLITGLTILLSRRYTIAVRLSGRNAVKVLATLFVLSVAKLGRAIIMALTYTVLEYPDGLHVSVWLPDANVKFLQGKHIPLFITAVVFSALVLCFVLVLTFIPCLQKKSDTPLLFWVNKIKPLFDAYTGPCKDRYRFWPGLLLLLLTILIFIFSLNDLDSPNMKLMLTAISCFLVLALAWVFCGVYTKWPLDIIESSCILNLGLLAVVTNYILHDSNNQIAQEAVVNTSTGIALALFISVLGYQLYKQLSTFRFCHRFVLALSFRKLENQQQLEELIQSPTDELNPELEASNLTEQLLPPAMHFDKYREPVLEYEDENTYS